MEDLFVNIINQSHSQQTNYNHDKSASTWSSLIRLCKEFWSTTYDGITLSALISTFFVYIFFVFLEKFKIYILPIILTEEYAIDTNTLTTVYCNDITKKVLFVLIVLFYSLRWGNHAFHAIKKSVTKLLVNQLEKYDTSNNYRKMILESCLFITTISVKSIPYIVLANILFIASKCYYDPSLFFTLAYSTQMLSTVLFFSCIIWKQYIHTYPTIQTTSRFIDDSIEHVLNSKYRSMKSSIILIIQSLLLMAFWFCFTYSFTKLIKILMPC